MLHVAGSRHTLVAVGLAATALLAACGSSRKVSNETPLCQRCHGGKSGNAAPPTSVDGATATTDPKVGAHQAHLVAGRLRGPIACAECHVVPADMLAHDAGIAAVAAGTAPRVVFGPLAAQGAAGAAYGAAGTLRCSNTYCHGATLNHGGTNQAPKWTAVDAGHTEAACGTCHGFPPVNASHPVLTLTFPLASDPCVACHSKTVTGALDATGFPGIDVAGGKHIDGSLTIDNLGGACNSCHGFPPTTGAHSAHTNAAVAGYGDLRQTRDVFNASATTYAFGCGQCHPLSFTEHGRHFSEGAGVFVQLTPDAGTAGSLRGLNSPAAAFNAAARTCSGIYCHSSGQAAFGAPKVLPAWNAPAGSIGCDGCHGNPPNYANGGAGTATANNHVALLSDGTTAWGHYAGLPGVSHNESKHGGTVMPSTAYWFGESAAPITCQTCHYRTTDPGHTGPSAFYYLDTTGSYDLGGAFAYACGSCHDGTLAPRGSGKVMPYFHVNGARDVEFDPRTDLSTIAAGYGLPAAPNTPTRPYWFTTGAPPLASVLPLPADATVNGTTLSLHLQSATWNAGTKTCGSVACHFKQTTVQWGGAMGSTTACATCHPT